MAYICISAYIGCGGFPRWAEVDGNRATVSWIQWCAHLWNVGDGINLHFGGAHDLRRGGVQDLHRHGEQETGPEGHALPETLVQVLVLVHQSVLACRAVHIDPGWPHGGQEPWRRTGLLVFCHSCNFPEIQQMIHGGSELLFADVYIDFKTVWMPHNKSTEPLAQGHMGQPWRLIHCYFSLKQLIIAANGWRQGDKLFWIWLTLVAIVWDFPQVDKMGSNSNIIDLVWVSYLDFDALAERREELGEDHLLVPDGFIAAFLDRRFPLRRYRWNTYYLRWRPSCCAFSLTLRSSST